MNNANLMSFLMIAAASAPCMAAPPVLRYADTLESLGARDRRPSAGYTTRVRSTG